MRRIFLSNGILSVYEAECGEGSMVCRDYQVYDENGQPSDRSFEGKGIIVSLPGTKDRLNLFLGKDTQTCQIETLLVDKKCLPSSASFVDGYRRAFYGKRAATWNFLVKQSQAYLDGWRAGTEAKKAMGT
jgi:hypothetical protein